MFYDFEKTVRKTGWSVRGFWVIIERFSRRSRENLEIITQKPRTDHPVCRTVCLRSRRTWNVLLLHFERNYFTGVNRLTPQTELLHTSKNEVKVIPSLPAQSWKSSISTRCFTPRWDWLLPTSRSGVKEITNTSQEMCCVRPDNIEAYRSFS